MRVQGGDITGLMIYGEITSATLREIPLSRLDSLDESTGKWWAQEVPPTEFQMRWAASPVSIVFLEQDNREGGTGDVLVRTRLYAIEEIDDLIREHVNVIPGETTDHYYLRFAAIVKAISPHVKSPNQRIASVSGLSLDTVKQYVFRCRKRRYLPPSRRSQK